MNEREREKESYCKVVKRFNCLNCIGVCLIDRIMVLSRALCASCSFNEGFLVKLQILLSYAIDSS